MGFNSAFKGLNKASTLNGMLSTDNSVISYFLIFEAMYRTGDLKIATFCRRILCNNGGHTDYGRQFGLATKFFLRCHLAYFFSCLRMELASSNPSGAPRFF